MLERRRTEYIFYITECYYAWLILTHSLVEQSSVVLYKSKNMSNWPGQDGGQENKQLWKNLADWSGKISGRGCRLSVEKHRNLECIKLYSSGAVNQSGLGLSLVWLYILSCLCMCVASSFLCKCSLNFYMMKGPRLLTSVKPQQWPMRYVI